MAEQQLTVQDSQLAAKWDSFLQDYCKADVRLAALNDETSFTVAFNDLQLRDPDLADYLLHKPGHCLRIGAQMLHTIDVPVEPKPRLHLRVRGLPPSQVTPISLVRAKHLGRFLALDGVVRKATTVRPQVLEAAFDCRTCGNRLRVVQESEHITEPPLCDSCEKPGPWTIREEDSRWIDHQKLELQEPSEGMLASRAERIPIHVQDDLAGIVQPGDRLRINGILTTQVRRDGNKVRIEYERVLQAVSIEVQERAYNDVHIPEEDEAAILALAASGRAPEAILKSFAHSIFGHDDPKKALLLGLFGGTPKVLEDGGKVRGDLHVLLVGDPGVAKTQLLRAACRVSPRSIFTSGKGSSAAGLTAAAVKDDFGDGSWTLEAGALVLADMGVAVVDELDKMEKTDRSAMHQAMEQQEISINKAGVQATLRSRCSVFGGANPKMGRFDAFSNIAEQIDLPPALFSRFDLMFALRDRPHGTTDRALAQFVLDLHLKAGTKDAHKAELSEDFLRKYIAYARTRIKPRLSHEATKSLEDHYVGLRSRVQDGPVPITPRQLESLVRLTEARARWELRDLATPQDAREAIALLEAYYRSVGIEAPDGQFDADKAMGLASFTQHDHVARIRKLVRELAGASDRGYARDDDVVREAEATGMTAADARKALETLHRNNELYYKGGKGTSAPLN